MCTSHESGHEPALEAPQAGAGRRSFLRATALIGAAATTSVALPTAAEAVTEKAASASSSSWRPDTESRRFTLAVMPDTQYLFDGPSINPAPIEASLRYLLEHGRDENIVFLTHLGDITENGAQAEVTAAGKAFELLDRRGVGYSVLAGNHDVRSSTTDQRGATPTWTSSDRSASAAGGPSAVPRPTDTTPSTSSRRPTASGSSSPWTGGCRTRATPGPRASSPSIRPCRSSSPRTNSSTRTTRSPRTGSSCGTSWSRTTTRSSSPSTGTTGPPPAPPARTRPGTTSICI